MFGLNSDPVHTPAYRFRLPEATLWTLDPHLCKFSVPTLGIKSSSDYRSVY